MYATNGYTLIQNLLANQLLKTVSNQDEAQINMMIIPTEPDEITVDKFVMLNTIFGCMVVALYIVPVFNTTFYMVKEKEQRMKETMRMMGMTDLPYWLSWFFYYTLLNTTIALLAAIVLKFNVFRHSTFGLYFLLIWGYGEALFGVIIFM